MLSDCVLLLDEMYLQKSVQYHSGNFVGKDEEGNLYKEIFDFIIASLKQSIPFAVKSLQEVLISGDWLKQKIVECIFNLKETDDHSANAYVFSHLLNVCDRGNEHYMFHPVYGRLLKTYLFFNIFHLIKNFRNNLLNRKKFVFQTFSFDNLRT